MRITRPYHGPIITLFAGMLALLFVPPRSNAGSHVAFRTVNGNLAIVPAYINGHGPFDFLVDTGTNTTLIDVQLAAELELEPVGRISLRTLAGSETAPRYFLGSLTVGAHSLYRMPALALDMSKIHRVDPRIRGMLGLDFLLEFAFLLDYGRKQIELYDPSETPDLANGTRVPIQIEDARILITTKTDASVNGSWSLTLDSGIGNIAVFENRIRELQNLFQSGNCKIQVTTNMSSFTANMTTVRDLTLANLHLRDVSVVVLPANRELQRGIEDGLLPASFFRCILVNPRQSYAMFNFDSLRGCKSWELGNNKGDRRQSASENASQSGTIPF